MLGVFVIFDSQGLMKKRLSLWGNWISTLIRGDGSAESIPIQQRHE